MSTIRYKHEEAPPLRLVLAHDHPLMRAGLAALLAAEGWAVVGQAGDGVDAVAHTLRLRPGLLLIGCELHGAEAAIAQLRRHAPAVKVLALTSDAAGEGPMLLAGATACLPLRSQGERLIQAVRALTLTAPAGPGRDALDALSPRELDILAHLSAGKTNKLIAQAAGIGVGTVKYHVNNILSKLNASCRTEAACLALRRGLVHPF